jgi:6-phosphogluconolactonase
MIKDTVFKSFDTPADLEAKLADKIAKQLQDAVDTRGKASLVVSGGSTPLKLFELLSHKLVDWSEKDSNERLVREHLLQNRAASGKFRGLKNMFATPEAGCDMTSESLANFPRPFDVVILGMGTDGHTCSWFPCSAELDNALTTKALCVAVNPTTAPHARITLSKDAILNSRQIYLHLVGEPKLTVYHQALENDDVTQMPIRAVLAQRKTPVDVFYSA